jgi:hypothetical protein
MIMMSKVELKEIRYISYLVLRVSTKPPQTKRTVLLLSFSKLTIAGMPVAVKDRNSAMIVMSKS